MLNIKLSVDQTNVVLNALGELPYVKSAELIATIRKQAEQQLSQYQHSEVDEVEVTEENDIEE